MPIWYIGKRREALTGSSEAYKKTIVRYLEKRGYYLKASSDVEAIFPDCILTRKDEEREYWLEAKATTISLRESSFLLQLGKYLTEYLIRVPQSRFRMILACYNIINPTLFEQIFEKFEPKAIREMMNNIVEISESDIGSITSEANPEDIKKFFQETIVIVANPLEIQVAEETITPRVPIAPTLSEAEYAKEILNKFGNIMPLQESDMIFLSIFKLSIPKKLHFGRTPYLTAKSIFDEKPNVPFPPFRLEDGKLYSFNEMTENSLLGKFVHPDSVITVNVEEFDEDKDNQRIVIRILNTWVKNECRRLGLQFDKDTKSYFFPKKENDDNPITIVWTPKFRSSVRELTKPMMTNGRINFWVHRAAEIYAKKFWENYYIQISPRWLFSLDGRNPFRGERADTLDRAFRKSIFNRNPNQFYDVLFWYRYIFSETDVQGNLKLDTFSDMDKQLIKVAEQLKLESDFKPNVEAEEEIEKIDKIEPLSVKLDEFM